jgi:hypothetical protein
LLSIHSRYGLHTRAATKFCGPLAEGFNHVVASIVAPGASGWSSSPGGAFTHWKAPPLHGAHPEVAVSSNNDNNAAGAAVRAAGDGLKHERQVYGSRLELHFGSTRPSGDSRTNLPLLTFV